MKFDIDAFVQAYAVAALWSSTGPDEGPYACENLDDIFSVEDISPECMAQMKADCKAFVAANTTDLAEYCQRTGNEEWSGEARAGHDYWLTRNGHGVGFWDRGLGELGQRLTKAAKADGEVFLYPGDDWLIYC